METGIFKKAHQNVCDHTVEAYAFIPSRFECSPHDCNSTSKEPTSLWMHKVCGKEKKRKQSSFIVTL